MLENLLIGACIGLAVALIFCIVIHFTIFKKVKWQKILWFYFAMFAVFAFTGASIFVTQFRNNPEVDTVTPQELMETHTSTISQNWKNTNGGFDFEQIQEVQHDSSAPTAEDQIIDLTCYDFGGYIVFAYKDGDVWQNALFYKSNNGLILDGMINMSAWMHVLTGFFNSWYEWESFKWLDYRNQEPVYQKQSIHAFKLEEATYDDLCSISRRTASFLDRDNISVYSPNDGNNFAMRQLPLLSGRNITDNFIKFGEVELIGTSNTSYSKINGFYNYLYQEIKGQNYNTSKIIDSSHCLCLPIPTSERVNYPISESKKADYGNADYYGVYKCDIAVNLTFKKGTDLTVTTRNENYIKELKNDDDYKDKLQVEEITSQTVYSEAKLKFVDTASSNLQNINFATNPVKITFSNANSETKTVLINSLNKLNGFNILLKKNVQYNFLIESDNLVFETYTGSFKITDNSTTLTFNYYYVDNYVVASVGLNPVGTMDTSQIDLVSNPVKIVLTNEDHTYQFEFNSNADLTATKTSLVELGTYDYTILSNQLVFASTSGQLTITTQNRNQIFNYALGGSVVDYVFMIANVSNTRLYDEPRDEIVFQPSYFDLLGIVFPDVRNVKCDVYFYNHENLIEAHSVVFDPQSTHNIVSFEVFLPTYTRSVQMCFYDVNNPDVKYFTNVYSFTPIYHDHEGNNGFICACFDVSITQN